MSSSSFRRPDFRLHLSYPEVTLLRSDVPGMVRLAAPDHPAFADDLRRLAAAIADAGGRLTVILPDREVWRDRLRLASRTPWARRREARDIAAHCLGVPAGDVALSIGRRGADGTLPLAATRRQTLVEVRRMLAAVGLRPEVIRGAGRFDGFSAPPALGSLRWNPARRPLPSRLPQAAMATGGLAATIAAVAVLLTAPDRAPTMSPGPVVHQSVARERPAFAEAAPVAPPVTAKAPVVRIATAAPPPSRPEVTVAPAAPAATAPRVTVSTRNVAVVEKNGTLVLKLDDLPGARGVAVEGGPAPLPRPRPAAPALAAQEPDAAPGQGLRSARPLPRPMAAADPIAETVRKVASADTEDFSRPEHRPATTGRGVQVASLTPTDATDAIVASLAAAAVTAPLPRPDTMASAPARPALAPRPLPATPPAPKPALAEAPRVLPVRKLVPITPKPAAAASAPTPRLQRAATAGAVALRPVATPAAAPVVVAAVAPQPKIVPITSTPKLTRDARTAATARAAATRAPLTGASTSRTLSQLSLIGVFGDTDAPHALVRLPSGEIERVRAGDNVSGLQVASVTADGVRLRSGGTEGMLRLPD